MGECGCVYAGMLRAEGLRLGAEGVKRRQGKGGCPRRKGSYTDCQSNMHVIMQEMLPRKYKKKWQ